jgi:hypothetical protein
MVAVPGTARGTLVGFAAEEVAGPLLPPGALNGCVFRRGKRNAPGRRTIGFFFGFTSVFALILFCTLSTFLFSPAAGALPALAAPIILGRLKALNNGFPDASPVRRLYMVRHKNARKKVL